MRATGAEQHSDEQKTAVLAGDQSTVLTILDRKSRQVVSTHRVTTPAAALTIFRSLGNGFDAQIRTPKYTELLLSW